MARCPSRSPNSKLGHWQIQFRPPGVKIGQHQASHQASSENQRGPLKSKRGPFIIMMNGKGPAPLFLAMFTRTSLEIGQRFASLKLGHREIQIRTQGLKYGQYPEANGNRLATPEPFLNSADADRTSVEGQSRPKHAVCVMSAIPPIATELRDIAACSIVQKQKLPAPIR